MNPWCWWVKNAALTLFSLLFFVLGVETLIASYRLNNPLTFIMGFFSASLIILISVVGVLYPVVQVFSLFKARK